MMKFTGILKIIIGGNLNGHERKEIKWYKKVNGGESLEQEMKPEKTFGICTQVKRKQKLYDGCYLA